MGLGLVNEIKFTINRMTPLLNKWQRMHWAQRRKETEQLAWLVKNATKDYRDIEPFKKCHVLIWRYSSKYPDWDGLYGGLKPLLDCFVVRTDRNPHGLGLIVDDNPSVIKTLNATPCLCKPKHGKTEVLILRAME
jgi:hypothetical protein